MKYLVECQTLVEFEIEADSPEQAEQIAFERVGEKCLYDADSIDWCVSAHEIKHMEDMKF